MAKRKKKRPVQQKTQRSQGSPLVIPMDDPSKGVPEVNRAEWLRVLNKRNSTALFEAIITYLGYFEKNHYKSFGPEDLKRIDQFMTMLMMTFSDPYIKFTRTQTFTLIMFGHILNGIAAMSCYETTDPILKYVLKTENNLGKLLFCENSRSEVQIPPEKFFNLDPELASIWYNTYLLTLSQPTMRQQTNQYKHLAGIDDRWMPLNHFVSSVYFTATYFAPDQVRKVKSVFNKALKIRIEERKLFKVNNKPNPKSIAIVTSKWHRNHAVYKSAGPLIEQLIGHYDLTLLHTARIYPDTLVKKGFKTIEQVYFDDVTGDVHIPPSLADNDFQMIYYPDIGMSNESLWMACTRIAPIQAMGYGHPDTSGDNSEIDYFIGGQIEEDATDCYSETMVLVPGLGQEPAWPTYERKNNWKPSDKIRVNCVWGPDKYNFGLLSLLKQVNDGAGPDKHEYHFFMSPGANRYGSLCAFSKDVSSMLDNVIFHTEQEYYDYMENAEQHDFSINSFPFGGYNTIVESLYLGLPCITLEGSRFYNRAAGYLLNKVDMPELVTTTPRDFITTIIAMITDPEMLPKYRKALAEMDLKEKLFTKTGDHFLDAINYIMENHPFNETVRIGSES
jgi:hypothetical protein